MQICSRPLDNFPLIRTRKIEEVRQCLTKIYAKPSLQPAKGVNALDVVLNEYPLERLALGYGRYGAALDMAFPAVDRVLQLFPIRGKGGLINNKIEMALTTNLGATISADTGYTASYDADYEHIVLRINLHALTTKLAALTGATIDKPLRIDPQQDFTRPGAQLLRQYLLSLIDTLSAAKPDTPFPAWWSAQTEQLLMTLFLYANRHNYSHLFEQEAPDASLQDVRRAEEYIKANWQQAITLEDLAEVTGLSAFSVFRTFKKSRGYSPLEFASRVRSGRTIEATRRGNNLD